MTPFRRLNHRRRRLALRYTTRLMPGLRRPRRPDDITLVCRAIEQIIRIDKSLRPFMQEQHRLVEREAFLRECDAALRRVYGPEYQPQNTSPPTNNRPSPHEFPQVGTTNLGKETVNNG